MANMSVEELYKLPKGSKTGVFCEKCGHEMVIREGHSKFLGCSTFPQCRHTMQFVFPEKSRVDSIAKARVAMAHPHLTRLFMQQEDWITDIQGNEEREFFDTLRMCFEY